MEVDGGYNGEIFVVFKLFSSAKENTGKNFEGAGTCVWRYGGAGSLEAEMIKGWKEEMMKVWKG